MTSRVFVGCAAALIAANVGHLPELATRHHPREMQAVVDHWLASDRDVACYNPYALDCIPREQAHRIICVALLDGRVEMRPLTEHVGWGIFANSPFTPGELWARWGEEWVFDGAPAPVAES